MSLFILWETVKKEFVNGWGFFPFFEDSQIWLVEPFQEWAFVEFKEDDVFFENFFHSFTDMVNNDSLFVNG